MPNQSFFHAWDSVNRKRMDCVLVIDFELFIEGLKAGCGSIVTFPLAIIANS